MTAMGSNVDFSPPAYDDVVLEMEDFSRNNNSVAPQFHQEQFDFGRYNKIKIVREPKTLEYGPFNFFIRDGNTDTNILLGEASYDRSASITRIDGTPLFKIAEIGEHHSRYIKRDKLKKFTQFNITRRNKCLGVTLINPKRRASPHMPELFPPNVHAGVLSIVNGDRTIPYLFKFTTDPCAKKAQILIFRREQNSEIQLAEISWMSPPPKLLNPFECSIEFSDPSIVSVTEEEKEFFVSSAIVFLMCRNPLILTRREHQMLTKCDSFVKGMLACFCLVALLTVAFMLMHRYKILV